MLWLLNNLATIIICAILAGILVLITLYLIRNKTSGKSSCGCACQGCPMSGSCHGGVAAQKNNQQGKS